MLHSGSLTSCFAHSLPDDGHYRNMSERLCEISKVLLQTAGVQLKYQFDIDFIECTVDLLYLADFASSVAASSCNSTELVCTLYS